MPVPPPASDPTTGYTVAVRALCEFTARTGDLDLRAGAAPTAQEGIAGHQVVAGRKAAGYEREVTLAGRWRHVRVRGRADGYDPAANRLDEVKTHRGPLALQSASQRALHWAQARVYGWLLCAARGLPRITLALVYLDIATGRETVLTEDHTADALRAFFEDQCERFAGWADQELAHRAARDAALQELRFPHAQMRPGQRLLAEAVWRAARAGRCLAAEAPTGVGKTLGTLFALLKAVPGQRIDRVFYLTAKTPQRRLALDAMASLAPAAGGPRVLELVAREKACEHPGSACTGAACPRARGFYDRLPAARAEAVARPLLDRQALRTLATAHGICPYYLGQELARWCDVVVGDYNHWFDSGAALHLLAAAEDWQCGLLVDEAHNLTERARAMYSAALSQSTLRALRRAAPQLRGACDRLQRAWNAANRACAPDGALPAYRVLPEPPTAWLDALRLACAAIGDHLAETPQALDAELQRFYFDALHLLRLAERFDASHSVYDLQPLPRGRDTVLTLRNIVPAPHLAPRWAAAHTATLFSATLSPAAFHADLLGLPEDAARVDAPSPFDATQLSVRVARHISTRWADRARSLEPIADLLAAQYAAAPGNYLAFFSSHDYLAQAAATMRARHPGLPLWQQERQMDEAARDAFLARFAPGGRGIGFAVLGGAFAEGIDLPGSRLVGAFIATLGLPQTNPVNEQRRHRLQQAFGTGYDYAYLYPGLQKVVQAAGRVIRTPEDRGVVHLMDDRFARVEVQRLLPAWWFAPAPADLR
ncbi:ATP-dependent DNA helicase [Xylophilus sp.]|uniref:ATP-dependent DNA helicase n=1 Tax=Xylophilus sp. TaxID=2653893 RepID=UPI0013BB27EC|nr:ATP-dependent DNA helicase [Xylophilus sp.]KAF1043624.1 MAG: hypothetical protein GAK38_03885 [Xylophilus sp.]